MEDAPAPTPVRAARPMPAGERDPETSERLRRAVLHRDADVLAINKPAGLATQGGTGTKVHVDGALDRSEEHTSELQSLMRNSYAVFCLKNTNTQKQQHIK